MKKILITLSALFLSSFLFAETIQCKVVGVNDGDTITCLTDGKQQIKVRLWGIDAPELDQKFGQESAQILSKILTRAPFISLEILGYATDGSALSKITYQAYIDCPPPYKLEDGTIVQEIGCMNEPPTNLNWQMIHLGYAWANPSHAYGPKELEKEAREAKLGLWTDPNPIPPWIWRKMSIQKNKRDADRILQEYRHQNP